MDLTLWHNPRCSKSRAALALLTERGHVPTLRLYLKAPPTRAEIIALLGKLGLPASGLIRRGETAFKDLSLSTAPEDALIDAMASHPILIERPILVTPEAARIGRPPEAILSLL